MNTSLTNWSGPMQRIIELTRPLVRVAASCRSEAPHRLGAGRASVFQPRAGRVDEVSLHIEDELSAIDRRARELQVKRGLAFDLIERRGRLSMRTLRSNDSVRTPPQADTRNARRPTPSRLAFAVADSNASRRAR